MCCAVDSAAASHAASASTAASAGFAAAAAAAAAASPTPVPAPAPAPPPPPIGTLHASPHLCLRATRPFVSRRARPSSLLSVSLLPTSLSLELSLELSPKARCLWKIQHPARQRVRRLRGGVRVSARGERGAGGAFYALFDFLRPRCSLSTTFSSHVIRWRACRRSVYVGGPVCAVSVVSTADACADGRSISCLPRSELQLRSSSAVIAFSCRRRWLA